MKIRYGNYVEPGFEEVKKKPKPFLTDEEYSKALSTFVFTCADTLVVSSGKLLLMHRKAKPASDLWWVIGGRMKFGETNQEAAARAFKRETKLEVSPELFRLLGFYEMCWKDRQQEPQDTGTHQNVYIHLLELSPEEFARLQFDEKEYHPEDKLLLTFEEAKVNVREGEFHPYIAFVIQAALEELAG